jgi:hypothetical protein
LFREGKVEDVAIAFDEVVQRELDLYHDGIVDAWPSLESLVFRNRRCARHERFLLAQDVS